MLLTPQMLELRKNCLIAGIREAEFWHMTIGEAVRERILELCAERDMTINKLSTISGITQSTVNNIVGGRNNSTTVSTIQKLCDGLGITIVEFFNDDRFKEIEPEVK